MASNSFGHLFRITTWGESHGKAIGVVIDGCPAGLEITEEEINQELAWRSPGKSPYTSPRDESDRAEIYSGVFEGKTTGAPISIIIANRDFDSSKYEPIKNLLRPGHANFTYLEKYGIFDHRGGGRASARETACRVAAGAVAKKLLRHYQIEPIAYIKEIENISSIIEYAQLSSTNVQKSPLFCPDPIATEKMMTAITQAKTQQDSVGGIVELYIPNLPVGLGDPVYHKLEAMLASAMLSIPASKGFEIGSGFSATGMRGSQHNDSFTKEHDKVTTTTNHAGGTLGGISTGMPLIARIAFKPTSSIQQKQSTVNLEGNKASFELPEGSRHDPCVAIRAVPVVEAMAALVIADAILSEKLSKTTS
ncbi:MAG: chorismate synthase [Parachlamydiaceae bacterium]|nr:chorismate synthase [Parachlamydiaceae bacterium]